MGGGQKSLSNLINMKVKLKKNIFLIIFIPLLSTIDIPNMAVLICDAISESAMHIVNDIWAQIFIKTSKCIDNQLFQKWNTINSDLIHRTFDYSPQRIVKRLQIWAANGPLDYTSSSSYLVETAESSFSRTFFAKNEGRGTNHVSKAFGSPDNNTRPAHWFFEVEMQTQS